MPADGRWQMGFNSAFKGLIIIIIIIWHKFISNFGGS
jgi:hypothetical protein